MRKRSSVLKYINPLYTALKNNPTTDDMVNNLIGVSAVTVPSVALISWLANRRKMQDMKEAIAKNTERNVNASMPVMQPDAISGNIEERSKRELNEIRARLAKRADGPSIPAFAKDWGTEIVYGATPLLALPLLTWLTAKGTNEVLKDKYSDDLDEENRRIQDMQDKVDMATLANLGYIRKKEKPQQNITKKANLIDKTFDMLAKATNYGEAGIDALKKGGITFPGIALLLAGGGLGLWGTLHYLNKHDDNQKLKLLEKRLLGKDQILTAPELAIELPKDYEETGKKTAQFIPGISPALIPQNIVEDAEIVEKSKKDAFLG